MTPKVVVLGLFWPQMISSALSMRALRLPSRRHGSAFHRPRPTVRRAVPVPPCSMPARRAGRSRPTPRPCVRPWATSSRRRMFPTRSALFCAAMYRPETLGGLARGQAHELALSGGVPPTGREAADLVAGNESAQAQPELAERVQARHRGLHAREVSPSGRNELVTPAPEIGITVGACGAGSEILRKARMSGRVAGGTQLAASRDREPAR
jgi:hypothetical protein